MAERRLTEGRLLEAAGDVIFGRGEDYVRHVRGLVVMGTCATGTVQAQNAYVVELDWGKRDLAADCTCPHFGRGFFCKHLVALGLAALEGRTPLTLVEGSEDSDLRDYLKNLEAGELRDLVAELAAREESVDQLLRVRAAVSGASGPEASKALTHSVTGALNMRGYIDYRRSFEVARDAHDVLDELEDHFDSGAADVIRPALFKALTRLRTITLNADDSGGSIGEACQRAADLYARSCREGSPDTVKLARWLAKFRDESPGWPITELADFAEAFDDRGLRAYRQAVDRLDEKYAGVDHFKRFEIDRMLLELADHDDDVDRAITILASAEHTDFRGIVDRLRAAGRDREVLGWIDRAVKAGRISSRMGIGPFWLDPAEVADAYLAVDRSEDAVQVLRDNFGSSPGLANYNLLLRYGDALGSRAGERDWAIAKATALATGNHFASGAVLVEMALGEGNLDAAWAAADEYGPGHQWRQLSKASEKARPRQAADLHLGELEDKLRHPNSPIYPEIATTLVHMKSLYERAGETRDFVALITRVRANYAKRPALMKALDKRGL